MQLADLTKQSRCRARRKAGLRVYSLTLPDIDLVEELIIAGYLRGQDQDDHTAVSNALQRAVMFLIFGKT